MQPRRLSRQHFALYRGYLQGAAYGEFSANARITRRPIATLRDLLPVAARQARGIEAAHLLRLNPGSIPLVELHGRDDVPTPEAYRTLVDPDAVYCEAELDALYRSGFPPPLAQPLTGNCP